MDLPEVAITSDSVSKQSNCSVYNLKTGALIASYKGFNSSPKCLSLVGDDFIISGVKGQPLLKFWTVSKKVNQEEKIVVHNEVSALAISNCGQYCIAGINKYIYLWEIKTGTLLGIISRHFQNISCLKFSCDGSFFISGGMDSLVMVWQFSEELKQDSERNPYFVWRNHIQPVTDIHVGSLGIYSRVATTSLDMTCRIYELDTGKLLVSVCMDVPLTSVVMDPAEYYLILGADNGSIYRINLFSCDQQEIHQSASKYNFEFKGHRGKINCLSVSTFGTTLLSGSDDKTCKIWDISTLACLKTISHEGPVTNAFIAVRPLALSDEKRAPTMIVNKFERQLRNRDEEKCNFSTHVLAKEVSLMKGDRIDDRYNPILLRGAYEHIVPDPDDLKVVVEDLKTINNQLYAHSLNSVANALMGIEEDL